MNFYSCITSEKSEYLRFLRYIFLSFDAKIGMTSHYESSPLVETFHNERSYLSLHQNIGKYIVKILGILTF